MFGRSASSWELRCANTSLSVCAGAAIMHLPRARNLLPQVVATLAALLGKETRMDVRKILDTAGWIVTILLQVLLGLFLGFVFSVIGRSTWLLDFMSLWLGDTIGVFAVGAVALLIRRSMQPRIFLPRLGATALAAMLPILILILLVLSAGYESELIQGGLGALLTMLTPVSGVLGFYAPRRKLKDEQA